MPYLPLPNFNHDSGPRRIQSGPDNEGYVVLYSGVEATGPNEGIVVAGSPLSGTIAAGAWDYDSNWRYVPGVLPGQSGSLDPTPYDASGSILDTYKGTRIATRTQVAGAQAADAIGPEFGVIRPGSADGRPEKYMYFGGAAPDNQGYSPYNTPDANTPAEGRTGGPVTHRNYENTLLTNVFGTQGTSDRSQWRYHQPVYCKTYTETLRSQSPGLMSTPLRYIYRDHSTSYGTNYGGQFALNANGAGAGAGSAGSMGAGGTANGFQQLPYDDQIGGCGIPVSCPSTSGDPAILYVGDVLTATPPCIYSSIEWFNTSSSTRVGTGASYTVQSSDIGYNIYFVVTYPDASQDSSSLSCYGTVELPPVSLNLDFLRVRTSSGDSRTYESYYDNDGTLYSMSISYVTVGGVQRLHPYITAISADRTSILWSRLYKFEDSNTTIDAYYPARMCGDSSYLYLFVTRNKLAGPAPSTVEGYLHLLTIGKSDGSVISDHAVKFEPTDGDLVGANNFSNGNVMTAITDGEGNFWVVFDTPLLRNTDPTGDGTNIAYVTKSGSGLSVNWAQLLTDFYYGGFGPARPVLRSAVDGPYTLRLIDGELVVGPYCSYNTSFVYYHYGAVLTRINPFTGFVIRKADWMWQNVDSSAKYSQYRDCIIDSDKNEYYWNTPPYNQPSRILIKRSSSGTILYAKDYSGVSEGEDVINYSFAWDGDDLILCFRFASGSVFVPNRITLMRINKDTGDLISMTRFEQSTANPNSDLNYRGFDEVTILPWRKEGEFTFSTWNGFNFGVNLSELTLPTVQPCVYDLNSNTPSGTYTITARPVNTPTDASGTANTGEVSPTYALSDYATITPTMFDTSIVDASGILPTGIFYGAISKLA